MHHILFMASTPEVLMIHTRKRCGCHGIWCIPSLILQAKRFEETSVQWRHNEKDGVSNHNVSIIYLAICSGADQRKQPSSMSLAFVMGIHRWSVDSPHKGPVTRKMFPFDDVTMICCLCICCICISRDNWFRTFSSCKTGVVYPS